MTDDPPVDPARVHAEGLPELYSYEGQNAAGRHGYSICLYDGYDDPTHECYATAYGRTEEEARTRAEAIVAALRAARSGSVPASPQTYYPDRNCGEPAPGWSGWGYCSRERGHSGDHIAWYDHRVNGEELARWTDPSDPPARGGETAP